MVPTAVLYAVLSVLGRIMPPRCHLLVLEPVSVTSSSTRDSADGIMLRLSRWGLALDYPIGHKLINLRSVRRGSGRDEPESWEALPVSCPHAWCWVWDRADTSTGKGHCCPGFGFTPLCGQVDKDYLNVSRCVTLHSSGPHPDPLSHLDPESAVWSSCFLLAVGLRHELRVSSRMLTRGCSTRALHSGSLPSPTG